MSENIKQQHFLLVQTPEVSYSVHLVAASLTLGRSENNSIVINDDHVSRGHALLIRYPVPGSSHYTYEIVDGDLSGSPSCNGTYVNNQLCIRRTLQHGDMIQLGDFTEIAYFKVHSSFEDLQDYLLLNADESSLLAFPGNSLETLIPNEAALEMLSAIEDLSGPATRPGAQCY